MVRTQRVVIFARSLICWNLVKVLSLSGFIVTYNLVFQISRFIQLHYSTYFLRHKEEHCNFGTRIIIYSLSKMCTYDNSFIELRKLFSYIVEVQNLSECLFVHATLSLDALGLLHFRLCFLVVSRKSIHSESTARPCAAWVSILCGLFIFVTRYVFQLNRVIGRKYKTQTLKWWRLIMFR